MRKGEKTKYALIAGVVLMAGILFYGIFLAGNPGLVPGKYDEFAQCLTDEGATFYGAFWCPHCANQKQKFGSSIQFVNYVECSTPDRRGQTAVCIEEGIQTYPTWEFADGSRQTGVLDLATLSEKTGCELS